MIEFNYRNTNNIIGWFLFLFSTGIFMLTLEPTASFWDAGERIACSYKLQVMHPPGAPLYQMMGRMFSLLAFGEVSRVAYWINAMSAVMGGLSVMFLFWTISIFGHRVLKVVGDMKSANTWAIWGAGIVGGLTLTFSDSFWFAAVEAEVYVTSLFFTALVFWSILKWEATEHEPDSLKWLILIAFIVGLSIGVHMLNLLAIPAIVYVYYFKKYKSSKQGIVIAGIVSILILGFIMNVFIPGVLTVDWWFERFFVNSLGLPFQSGTIFYFAMLLGLIVFGLYYTHKKKKVLANTIILALMFILIGYTSFFMLVIRSNAYVPINENAPKDALAMKAYLGREQYGGWPLLYGPHFNAPLTDIEDGNPVWRKDREQGKYVIINERKGTVPVYDSRFETIFPRMYSTRQLHVRGYQSWGRVEGTPLRVQGRGGEMKVVNKPTFVENMRFFFSYQLNHMYMRYLMWNFAGRQSDMQGHGEPHRGNWMSGIQPLDALFLGPQSNLPESITSNPGHSKYFLLPLLLGIIGLAFQIKQKPNDAWVVALLFIMTGIAIIVYLNQTPFQPRERDYSYIGSFYTFSIWVGLGVLSIYETLRRKLKGKQSAVIATLLCLLLVPTIMAQQNWNNHDRSGRYTTRDVAVNYLESCEPNAIIFTMGDNDTFPLWYAQEVEGIRTDIKVVNLSLLNTDWYIDYMVRRQTYEAEPVPFSLEPRQYRDGTRDVLYVFEDPRLEGQYVNLRSVVNFIANDQNRRNIGGAMENFFPTKKFRLPVDSAKVVENGIVAPEDAHLIVDAIEWTFPETAITKNYMMVMDFLVANNWERPVYWAITVGSEGYMGLEEYFQLDGMTYQLVPIRTPKKDGQIGRINTDVLYNNIMNKFQWGNMYEPSVYLSEDHVRLSVNFRNIMQRLANALIEEGQLDRAVAVLDRAMEKMPEHNVPYNYFTLLIAEAYMSAEAPEKAVPLIDRLIELEEQNLKYYFSFRGARADALESAKSESLMLLQRMNHTALMYDQLDASSRARDVFDYYYELYMQGF